MPLTRRRGSTTASDAIWRELVVTRTERADRPLVVSMSDLAASGGYYMAMTGDPIVAYAATLTIVLLALLGSVALAQFWFLERKVHYQ